MANQEAIKVEVQNVINSVAQPLIKQYPAAKHQIVKLQELGLLEYLPLIPRKTVPGYTHAAAVIEAATDNGTTRMNIHGEGETVGASKLYQLLNEKPVETEAIETVTPVEVEQKPELSTYQKRELAVLIRQKEIETEAHQRHPHQDTERNLILINAKIRAIVTNEVWTRTAPTGVMYPT